MQVIHAKAIGAQQSHAGAARHLQDAVLQGGARYPHLGKPGAENDRAAHPFARAGLNGRQYGIGRQGQHGAVRMAGHVVHGFIRLQPLHLVAARIDRENFAGKPDFLQMPQGAAADARDIAGGADHGDRTRTKKNIEAISGHHPSLRLICW